MRYSSFFGVRSLGPVGDFLDHYARVEFIEPQNDAFSCWKSVQASQASKAKMVMLSKIQDACAPPALLPATANLSNKTRRLPMVNSRKNQIFRSCGPGTKKPHRMRNAELYGLAKDMSLKGYDGYFLGTNCILPFSLLDRKNRVCRQQKKLHHQNLT